MTEEEIGKIWLKWERKQVKIGKRRILPCDLSENRTSQESRLRSDELNDDQIKILKILKKYGAQSSIKLGKKLNKKSVSISLLVNKLISQNKVRRVGKTDRGGPRKNGTRVWIYDVVEEQRNDI